MAVERGFRKVNFESDSLKIVLVFRLAQVIGEVLHMTAILLYECLPLQSVSLILIIHFDIIKFYRLLSQKKKKKKLLTSSFPLLV